ncbi:MAG: hypothetical protein OXG08_07375 [Gammaproteobacteria bacterium]|nr:hypothetical protein [Gammaproteobacteria bacterium]
MSAQESKVTRYLIGIAVGVTLTLLVFFAYSAIIEAVGSDNASTASAGEYSSKPPTDSSIALGSSTSDLGRDLPALPQQSSDFDRSAALYSLLEKSERHELIGLLYQSQEIEHSGRRASTLAAIGQRLADIDPYMALEVSLGVPMSIRASLLTGVYQEWSLANLDDAVASVQTLDTPMMQAALQTILETRSDLSDSRRREIASQFGREEFAYGLIAKQVATSLAERPEDAWNALLDDGMDDVYQLRELREVSLAWAERNGIAVLNEVHSALNEPRDRWLRTELTSNVVELDPQAAFNHVLAQPPEERRFLLNLVASTWARSDPQGAFEAAASVEPASEAKILLGNVIQAWARNDPHEILSGLEQFDPEMRLVAAERAISSVAWSDPSEAAKLVEEIRSKVSNASSIESSLNYHRREEDPRAALDWLLEEPQRGGTRRNSLIESTLEALAHVDPEHAFQVGLQQPLVWEGDTGMEAAVISELSSIDIEAAIALLPKVREESKVMSHVWMGVALVRQRDPHRALELGAQVPESDRDFYYAVIADDWAESNPIHLFEEMDQLDSPKLKSMMAQALLINQTRSPILTQDQVERARSSLTQEDAEEVDRLEGQQ